MTTNKKYTLVKSDTVTTWDGRKLYRIKAKSAIKAIGIAAGMLGGYIESEKNLDQSGNAWVFGDARVYGNAWVSGNAWVYGNARVYGNAWVFGDAWVYGDARVYGNAWVSGNAWVYGNAQVFGDARVYGNAQVYGNARVFKTNITAIRSDNYTFSVVPTPDGPRIIAGCRYFTFDEARKHWSDTRGGTQPGDESLALVDHLERMARICGLMEPVEEEPAND